MRFPRFEGENLAKNLAIVDVVKAVAAAEKIVDRLSKEKTSLEARLADPKLYEGPAADVTKLQRDLGHVAHALAQAEDEWLTAHEAYEDAAKIAG